MADALPRDALVRLAPLRRLLVRGCALYFILHVTIAMVSAVAQLRGDERPDHPLGIIALTMVLGAIDIRRRGEWTLWANLGFSTVTLLSMFGVPALVGELVLASLGR